jgi:hypothetical protein
MELRCQYESQWVIYTPLLESTFKDCESMLLLGVI